MRALAGFVTRMTRDPMEFGPSVPWVAEKLGVARQIIIATQVATSHLLTDRFRFLVLIPSVDLMNETLPTLLTFECSPGMDFETISRHINPISEHFEDRYIDQA